MAAAMPAWAYAPLTDEAGEALSWPAEAWPLPLATTALPDRRAAAAWTAAGPAAWSPEADAPLGVDGKVAVIALDTEAWAQIVGDPALVAFTLITHEGETLLDTDVVLNTDRFELVDPPQPRLFSRASVVGHELGHVLGLGHPCGVPDQPRCEGTLAEALMAPRLPAGDHRPVGADDREGLAQYSKFEGDARRPAPEPTEQIRGHWSFEISGLEPGDVLVRHGAQPTEEQITDEVHQVASTWDVRAVELWTTAGQGAVVDAPTPIDWPLHPPATPESNSGGGCHSTPIPSNALWALLVIAITWRRGSPK